MAVVCCVLFVVCCLMFVVCCLVVCFFYVWPFSDCRVRTPFYKSDPGFELEPLLSKGSGSLSIPRFPKALQKGRLLI